MGVVYQVAKEVDPKTMTLQYLDALRSIGASPSTKYFFPLEFTKIVEQIRDYVSNAQPDKSQ